MLSAGPAAADFADGLAAYDAGDCYAAYPSWLPLSEAGDGDAKAAIADLYLSELLTTPAGTNESRRMHITAAWWDRRAARCGHPVGQINLGDLYARGVGAARDQVAAYVWLGLAARRGNVWAAQGQREIASGLPLSQIASPRTASTLGRRPPIARDDRTPVPRHPSREATVALLPGALYVTLRLRSQSQ